MRGRHGFKRGQCVVYKGAIKGVALLQRGRTWFRKEPYVLVKVGGGLPPQRFHPKDLSIPLCCQDAK